MLNGTANLSNSAPIDPHDRMNLGNSASLTFISVDIFLVKPFLILFYCPVIRNNSRVNSWSCKLYLVILNVVPVLFLLHIFICLVYYLLV